MLVSGTFRSLPYAGNEFPSVQSQSLGGQALALNIPRRRQPDVARTGRSAAARSSSS